MPRPSWDEHWMAHATLNAEMSTCMRLHVGAVAVRDRYLLAAGFNGNVSGARHCDEGGCARCADDTIPSGVRLEECVCVHAEANLVAYAARRGVALAGSVVYCTHHPCVSCLKMLDACDVEMIFYATDYPRTIDVQTRAVLRRLPAW